MEEINVATWEEFLEGLEEIRKERASSAHYVQDCPLLFRGQRNSCWQLSPTLERACERMLYKDYYRIIAKIRPQIESLVGGDWSIPPYPEVERLVATYDEFNNILWAGDRPAYAYMAYLRHHGFARITPDDFYAINVYQHGAWEQMSVLESLHRNWPDAINSYRIQGIHGEPLSEAQRRNLRNVNMQTATTTADGTVYMAIGGGVAGSGTSAEAVRRADMLWSDAEQLQISVQEQFEKFLPALEAGGYAGQAEIKATLMAITPEASQVVFPEYGVLANVKLEGGWFHRWS